MTTIPLRELRNDYAGVLRRVEEGENFTITRDGQPVAQLSPYVAPHAPRRAVPVADLRTLLSRPAMTQEQVADLRADLAEADWAIPDPDEEAHEPAEPIASERAEDARAVREWAAANGITVAPRGPVATSLSTTDSEKK
ncbi:type II toxin-antitoxin system prevent-host-death family antitoxin [Kineococcus sp. TBRC 1896]|uniref:Antitoxin n=1 Tax=Kineococcus mangrovi TaxID=1660183 RepID=A0ABV4I706_9ACTN